MSTNKPSNDQPDKASDFDDELGVPSYYPKTDSTSGATDKSSAASSASPSGSTTVSASKPAEQKPSGQKSGGPNSEPTLSFNRPGEAEVNKANASQKPAASKGSTPSGANSSKSQPAGSSSNSARPAGEGSKASASSSASAATGAAAGAVGAGAAAGGAGANGAPGAKKDAAESGVKVTDSSEPKRSSVFDRPGRAQPQEITPNSNTSNTNQAPQAPVESQPTETMTLGPTTGSQNNSYDDRDFANRNDSSANDPTTVTPAQSGYGDAQTSNNLYSNEPTTVNPAVAGAGAAGVGAAGAGANAAPAQQFDTPSSYSDETAMALDAETAAAAQAEEEKALRKQYGKRGTIDFGLLFIRIALGAYLIIEGVRTLFTIGDSAGISGLETEFANYAMANILAIGVPVAQLGAGVFLVLGLLTPFAAMVGMVVTGFLAIHELAVSGAGLDVFGWPETLWLSLILFVINVGIQFTGPGFISVDSALGVKALSSPARRPLASSWIFFILGAAALVAVWWFGAGINPLP
ncbi:DoxX family protein [Corynebacterium sp. L4756]|uniref:DoxX family protein n=1 Tax=unclassified Corynebacterium TaxID=2624378 RepID=UPI00374DD959